MKELTGIELLELPFEGLEEIRDLIYYDGPILALFRDDQNRFVVFYWVDFNSEFNRWMVWEIDVDPGDQMMYPIQQWVRSASVVYTVDIDRHMQYQNIRQLTLEEIPEAYLPYPNYHANS